MSRRGTHVQRKLNAYVRACWVWSSEETFIQKNHQVISACSTEQNTQIPSGTLIMFIASCLEWPYEFIKKKVRSNLLIKTNVSHNEWQNNKSQMFEHGAWSGHSSGLSMKTMELNYLGSNCHVNADDSHIYIFRLEFFLKPIGWVHLNPHRVFMLNMLKREAILFFSSIHLSRVLYVSKNHLKPIKLTS